MLLAIDHNLLHSSHHMLWVYQEVVNPLQFSNPAKTSPNPKAVTIAWRTVRDGSANSSLRSWRE